MINQLFGDKNRYLFELRTLLPGHYDKKALRVRDLSVAVYLEFERRRVNCPGCSIL